MAEQTMETTLRTALWQQFGAAIDMLENALLACPSAQWNGLLWKDPQAPGYPTGCATSYIFQMKWLERVLHGIHVALMKRYYYIIVSKHSWTKGRGL